METITINITNEIDTLGKPIVVYKRGRRCLGWTERWDTDGKWHNHRVGFSFSASDTLERAVWVMKEHLCDTLDPFKKKKIIYNQPK